VERSGWRCRLLTVRSGSKGALRGDGSTDVVWQRLLCKETPERVLFLLAFATLVFFCTELVGEAFMRLLLVFWVVQGQVRVEAGLDPTQIWQKKKVGAKCTPSPRQLLILKMKKCQKLQL